MKEWFTTVGGEPFNTFGTSHLLAITVSFIGILLIINFRKNIRTNLFLYQAIRYSLFIILITAELVYQLWALKNNIWNPQEFIPLHLCGIAGITAAVALVTNNKKLILLTYFIGFIPPLLALLTPVLPYDYPHFRYWKFFIHHMAISWSAIFLIITIPLKISWRDMFHSYGYLIGYAAVIGFLLNPMLNANYLFLNESPTGHTLLTLLGDGIFYYANLCLLALILFSLLVVFHKIFSRK
ncbi:YwaF family protein [Oceanobacillus halotolerans]|uniref:YwaF family protein n=1 Tax=Oceanobacillus halotolerans TaxID=2663380 RepID=UPI0013DA376D|nr:TIGR02206 family membrane protein [Oceanobacillus halotolerans]